jgi:hypothetical protein
MKLPVFIIVSDTDSEECGDNCPFLNDNACALFNADLADQTLPDGYEWNDRDPTKLRCSGCSSLDYAE